MDGTNNKELTPEMTTEQRKRLTELDEEVSVPPRPKKQFSEEEEQRIELFAEAIYRCARRIEAEDAKRELAEDEIQAELEDAEDKLKKEEAKKNWYGW